MENTNLWQYIKPELHETLNTTVNQNKTIYKSDEIYYNTTVNEGGDVDLFNGSLYSPVKIEDIKTRQKSSDDSLGISVRSSEPTAEIVIENVENGNVRNCHFTDDDRDQVRTKNGKQNFSHYFVTGIKGSPWSRSNGSWMYINLYILCLSMFVSSNFSEI